MVFQLDSSIYERAAASRRADEQMRMNRQQAGRNAQLDNMKMQKARVEQASRYLDMATPENWPAIRQEAIAGGLGSEATIPVAFDADWVNRARSAFSGAKSSMPSSVQEYEYYQNLPAEKQSEFMGLKRSPYINLGDRFYNPYGGESYEKGVSPEARPALKGAQAQAEADVELEMKPKIESAVTTAKGEAEAAAAEKKALPAKTSLQNTADRLLGYYDELEKIGAVVSPENTVGENIAARAGSSAVGQYVAGYVGTRAQSIRDKIAASRPAIINDIRQATGMGAKAMDSNVELQFYLKQATDPSAGVEANREAIQVLKEKYGLGRRPSAGAPRKFYSPSRNQTKIVYPDGREEIVDGRQ